MLNLMRRQLERNGLFLAAVMLVLGVFEFLICALVASVDVKGMFGEVTRFAPPLIRAMIEQNFAGGSPAAVLSFGWNHPVAHALLTAVAITLGARAIAGEVEGGVIELVMAQPLSRARYFAAHAVFAALALSLVLAGGLLGTAIGQHVHSIEAFGARGLAALFVNAFLLQASLFAVTLLASAFARESGRAAIAGVLVAVISFLVNAIATLWDKAAFAKPYSLHHYFEPRDILAHGQVATASLLVLGSVTAVALAFAFAHFLRRDVP